MADNGVELGADLYMLWRAGRDDLPAVATIFRTAGRDLQRVRHDDPNWTALQQELDGILARTAATLENTGKALCTASLEYARADAAAAAELERRKRVDGDPVPYAVARER
jgi:hypothetical protein